MEVIFVVCVVVLQFSHPVQSLINHHMLIFALMVYIF